MPESVRIRRARSTDARALAAFAERAFRAAFEADNAPADLDAYVRGAFSDTQIADELASPEATFFLAAHAGGPLLGYAKLRAGRPSPAVASSRREQSRPADATPVELHRLYVAPEAIGTGVGAALMGTCLNAARSGGHDVIWLGVWEENARALAFYRRWGFEAIGEQAFTLGSDVQTDLVLQRGVS